ncbi:MAG: PAS domain S-box protein [Alphaproteobacteria bacterium]|nr:PAS domain S-box protein [Alphaproteobacteria bacterium]
MSTRPSDVALAHLAAIVTSSNDAIVGKTTEGVVQSWNAAAERMFGYSAEEMIGRSIRTIIPPDRQQEEDDILARISRGQDVKNFATMRQHKSGRVFPVSVTVSPIVNEAGVVVGASKIARDISDQMAMVQKLRESEERFRTLADNISQLAWMADREGYVFWYNRRWYEFTGTTLDEVRGWGWRKVHHPDHVERVVARIQRSWDTGEIWEDTFPLRGADGAYRWFLSRALPIRDDSGAIVRWFGSNTDITELKEREERIELLLGELNHRSKNMLAVVQAIARQAAGPHEKEFTRRLCARLQAMTASQDVLVSSGWRGADAQALIKSQLAHFGDLIGTRISIEGPPATLTPQAAQALGLALHELSTNAGKYGALSNRKGSVRISWRVLADRDKGRRFSIEWAESGGPAVKAPERRGFGLSVIDWMSKLSLGARVEVDFRPEGLVWRLTCRDGRALESAETYKEAARGRVAGRKGAEGTALALVVEDDAVIALDIAGAIEDAGYKVVGPAATVAEALGYLAEYPCDLAVLDVDLGLETSEEVARELVTRAIPFVAVSGFDERRTPPIFRNVRHLTKPIDMAELRAGLSEIAPAPRGRAERT